MSQTLRIGTARVGPGEKMWGSLLAREAGPSVRLPVALLNGRQPGPHMVIVANQHGSEINGLAAIREFVGTINPRKMRGTLVAFPCANPLAAALLKKSWIEEHEGRHHKTNEDRYNMNGNWPGKQGGTLVQRAIHEIWQQAILTGDRRADFVLDIHSHQAASAVYARTAYAADLGLVSGYRNIVLTGGGGRRTLGGVCVQHGIMSLTLEPEGQMAFYPDSVRQTVRAIRNLAVFWDLLPGCLDLPEEAQILDPWKSQRLGIHDTKPSCVTQYARHPGLFLKRKRQYDRVRKHELVGEILDPHAARARDTVRAPMGGVLYMLHTGPAAVDKGERLMSVSTARRVGPEAYLKRKRLDCGVYKKREVIMAPGFSGQP